MLHESINNSHNNGKETIAAQMFSLDEHNLIVWEREWVAGRKGTQPEKTSWIGWGKKSFTATIRGKITHAKGERKRKKVWGKCA